MVPNEADYADTFADLVRLPDRMAPSHATTKGPEWLLCQSTSISERKRTKPIALLSATAITSVNPKEKNETGRDKPSLAVMRQEMAVLADALEIDTTAFDQTTPSDQDSPVRVDVGDLARLPPLKEKGNVSKLDPLSLEIAVSDLLDTAFSSQTLPDSRPSQTTSALKGPGDGSNTLSLQRQETPHARPATDKPFPVMDAEISASHTPQHATNKVETEELALEATSEMTEIITALAQKHLAIYGSTGDTARFETLANAMQVPCWVMKRIH